jgi:hypothetical protein
MTTILSLAMKVLGYILLKLAKFASDPKISSQARIYYYKFCCLEFLDDIAGMRWRHQLRRTHNCGGSRHAALGGYSPIM